MFLNYLFILNLSEFSLNIEQFFNIFISIVGFDSRYKIIRRKIFYILFFSQHDIFKLLSLTLNALSYHCIKRITTIYFNLF